MKTKSLPEFSLVDKDVAKFMDDSCTPKEVGALQSRLGSDLFERLKFSQGIYRGLQAPKYQYRLMHTIQQIVAGAAIVMPPAKPATEPLAPIEVFPGQWPGLRAAQRDIARSFWMLYSATSIPARAASFDGGELKLDEGTRELFRVTTPREAKDGARYVVVTARKKLAARLAAVSGRKFFAVRGHQSTARGPIDWQPEAREEFTRRGSGQYVAEIELPTERSGIWRLTGMCQ